MKRALVLVGVILSSCVLPRVDFDESLSGDLGGAGNAAIGGTNSGGSAAIGGTTSSIGGTHATAGTSSVAGTSAAGAGGGAPVRVCKPEVGDPAALLINDFDTGSLAEPQLGGRYGAWSTFSDMSATCSITPQSVTTIAPGYNAMGFAASFTGVGCTLWGGATSIVFNGSSSGGFCAYDVSVYDGITFYARSDNSTVTRVQLMQTDIQLSQYGGTCTLGADKCSDFYAKSIALTPTWALYTINFKDLKQQGFGAVFAFTPSKIFGLEVGPAGPSPTATSKFDVEFDDVSFKLAASGGSGGVGGSSGAGGHGGSGGTANHGGVGGVGGA